MNFDHLFIRDLEGERKISASELPLRVGTGTDCTLRLPGPGGAPVALLDLLDGVPFVQPVGRDTSLAINGEPLETSRRLQDGDELVFYGSRIQLAIDDERVLLDVKLEDSAYVTKPPPVADDELPDDEAIAPTAFRRAAATAAQTEVARKSPLKMILGGGLALLLFASYLLFSSKSVEFEIDPRGPDGVTILAPYEQYKPNQHPGVTSGDPAKPMILFDLEADPAEQHDVADQHAEVVARLLAMFQKTQSTMPQWPEPKRSDLFQHPGKGKRVLMRLIGGQLRYDRIPKHQQHLLIEPQ